MSLELGTGEALLTCLASDVGARTHGRSRPGRERSLSSGRVLLAEDDPEFRRLLAAELSGDGFEVVECEDGFQLVHRIEQLATDGELGDAAVIVSDLRMPGCSGLDAARLLRRAGVGIPLILMTAFGDLAARTEGSSLGVAAFFEKPFSLPELCSAVRAIGRSPARGR